MEPRPEPARSPAHCEASAAREELAQGAQQAAEAVRARTSGALDERRRAAADRIGHTASALRSAAEQMRAQDAGSLAWLADDVAGRMDAASRRLRDEDLDSLMASATDLARRQPVAFFGAAVAAGFALSRFLKASASRRHASAGGAGQGGF
jgi:hypothetical protein